MKTDLDTQPWLSPEGLAADPQWLRGLTEPAQRLVAATAYRAHPDQTKGAAAREDRFEAAALAIGATPEAAKFFRHNACSLAQAAKWAVEAEDRAHRDFLCGVERQRREEKEARFWKSKRGQRRSRQLKQRVLQVHYCNGLVECLLVTNRVWHGLLKTPLAARLTAFSWGTLGEHDDYKPVHQSIKRVRRLLAQRLLSVTGTHDVNGEHADNPDALWTVRNGALTEEAKVKAHSFFERRILAWCRRQVVQFRGA